MTCDVIIVGAGPAGSSCANDLVRAGASVVLVDRATFPRDKCCAGWLTPQAVQALDLDLLAAHLVVHGLDVVCTGDAQPDFFDDTRRLVH